MIELIWPPSSLAGHNTGHRMVKGNLIAKHREWARLATLAAKLTVPESGDIPICFYFCPPNNRGDRVNYPIRIKPLIDGIADALGVNDKRFLPSYLFGGVVPGGKVVITIGV